MATTKPRSQTPRPQCNLPPLTAPCSVWQFPAGCGFLDAGVPCRHSVERHRFDQDGCNVIALPGLGDESDIIIQGTPAQMPLFP
jgi:hypothetical protein